MNIQALEQARNAYRTGDFASAAQLFAAAKDPSELAGEADHLRGNSLMRLGRYAEAVEAYGAALQDGAYGKRGALLTNQGKALVASGDIRSAVSAFSAATQDASYATPYKAYLGLGDALKKLGNLTEAGVAYRQAAIDGANPAPAGALANLGDCFVALQRPEDAIESYRTALDFAGPRDDTRAISTGLGQAYVAANRFSDAVDAFGTATVDGIYQLTPEQADAYERARDTLSASSAMVATTNAYSTDIDPLDPLGQSGSFMPDPSDTGFFTLSEQEMVQQDRVETKVRRKRRHTGLKVFIALLVVLLIAGGGAAFAYTRGFGFPSQQDVLTGLFQAATDGSDASEYLASGLDESQKSIITASIPLDATPTIEGMDAGMSEATATVKVALKNGGDMTYEVGFVREGLGWAVSSVSTDFNTETSTD
ncbi:tetratricopeptide repeat protein [uncultured Collinsella sp.]|uniref:tetratricopeptide repeat protein n=1 Tax=uncultured Collinsella sp. TaxID=165190 RepID=UPI0025D9770C|nr:tetratricopeptide repeat protein [uncultured Collinsella sp.]